jgi:hypothetical protein
MTMAGCCQWLGNHLLEQKKNLDMYEMGQWGQVFGFGTKRFFEGTPGRYMAFKVISALSVTGIFAWSMAQDVVMYDCKAGNPHSSFFQWFIYLTHWTLTLQLIWSWLSTYTVYKAQSASPSELMPFHAKATWVLYGILIPQTFLVFVQYFALVYDPAHATPLSFFTHGANFVIMITSVFASGVPYYIRHAFSYFISVGLYLAFTFVFFHSGGKNCSGMPYIYEAVDYSTDIGKDQAKETILSLYFVFSPAIVIGLHLVIAWCFPQRGIVQSDEKEAGDQKHALVGSA